MMTKVPIPEEGHQSYWSDKNIRGSHHKISMELERTSENDSRKTIERQGGRTICLENEYMGDTDQNFSDWTTFKTLKRVNSHH